MSEVIDAHRDKSEQTTVLGEDFDDGADAIPRADRTASFLCLLDLPLDVPRLVSSNDDADGIATETNPALIAAPGTCGSLLIVRTAPYTSGCTAVQPYQRRDARNRTSMWSSPEWVEQGTVRKNMTVKPPPSPLYLTRTQTRTHTRPACDHRLLHPAPRSPHTLRCCRSQTTMTKTNAHRAHHHCRQPGREARAASAPSHDSHRGRTLSHVHPRGGER